MIVTAIKRIVVIYFKTIADELLKKNLKTVIYLAILLTEIENCNF